MFHLLSLINFKYFFRPKYLIFVCILIIQINVSQAQKPVVQLDSYKNWTEVKGAGISNDGQFYFYQIENALDDATELVVKSRKKNWEKRFVNLRNASFSNDSHHLLGLLPDTLSILNLINGSATKIPNIDGYKQLNNSPAGLLVYLDKNKTLFLSNTSGKVYSIWPNVNDYFISPNSSKIIIQQNIPGRQELILCDVENKSSKIIYSGQNISNIVMNDSGTQLAFISSDNNLNFIWYFHSSMIRAKKLVNPTVIDSNLRINLGAIYQFSGDGKRLFFYLTEHNSRKEESKPSDLDIWSYEDAYLKSAYYNGGNTPEISHLASVDLKTGHLMQLLHGNETIASNMSDFKPGHDSILLVKSSFGPTSEQWNPSSATSYMLCNTKTGKMTSIASNLPKPLAQTRISPGSKYLVYFDPSRQSYCSFTIATGEKKILTNKSQSKAFVRYDMQKYPSSNTWPNEIHGWLNDEETIVVQGRYDLWSLDILNRRAPINLTHFIGENQKIVFYPGIESFEKNKKSKLIILTAFNTLTKDFGFYKLALTGKNKLTKLSMAKRYCGTINNVYTGLSEPTFFKSKNNNSFLFRWENFNQAPNYFLTTDFKEFEPISDNQPQLKYNWLKSELHSYKDSLGNVYEGILYKPDDFDSKKKYPLIMEIYEDKGNFLNKFPSAVPDPGVFSLAFMVSNGYLVFLPDVKKEIPKHVGDCIRRSVIAAADYLKQYDYIDQKKLGICGGSTGGFETNYIITQTNRFAAAISAAGISDLISQATMLRYGSPLIDQLSGFGHMMGGTLPEDPETYVKNSPILYSKNIQTPLLLSHNSGDMAVSYLHSQSLFIVLRRLQKKVWWINYKNEDHGISNIDKCVDYHKRALGFWDFYLNDKDEPEWMKNHLSGINR